LLTARKCCLLRQIFHAVSKGKNLYREAERREKGKRERKEGKFKRREEEEKEERVARKQQTTSLIARLHYFEGDITVFGYSAKRKEGKKEKERGMKGKGKGERRREKRKELLVSSKQPA